MSFRIECWRLRPAALPRLVRHCPQCGVPQPFICNERFRMNAQKKVIDVWLLYRCRECEDTWKLPIHSRAPISRLAASEIEAFERNDRAAAHLHACDVSRIRTHVTRIELAEEVHVEREVTDAAADAPGDMITIAVIGPCDIRLDRLLARELGISRSALQDWAERGRLRVEPQQKESLRRRACDGQRICFVDGIACRVGGS